jgi:hypothetical protein
MKKTLLLSVAASTMIMAGGDIAPVEPVAEAPAVVAESGWDFSGQAVVYYQTNDVKEDLFSQESARADFGLQLRAVNKDVFGGVGFGGEVSGLSTLNLEDWLVDNVMQGVGNGDLDDMTDGGWISQLYMTYAAGNTSFKLGRQELPKALSPFAFSEKWNVFSNTFDSVLVVNTDISNTTLVGAWVYGGNHNGLGLRANMSDFNEFNDDNGVFMLTAQNKSFDGVTLTGTWYYASEYVGGEEDANILWGDALFGLGGVNLGLQVGTVMSDGFNDDTVAIGAKAGYNFGMFDASLAYSTVNDGGIGVFNVGGVKTPLYTQMILNQNFIRFDSDTFVARAGMKALGGKFGLAYDYSDVVEGEYTELDFVYKTKVFNDSTTLFAGYIYQDLNADNDYIDADFDQNVIRFWARYNF